MELRYRVARNLQRLRRTRQLSQEGLALLADVDRSYVGKIENSHYAVSIDFIEQLAQALGISPLEFLLDPVAPETELWNLLRSMIEGKDET
jgi:transcriptional regulator with XRE-family HTH domain